MKRLIKLAGLAAAVMLASCSSDNDSNNSAITSDEVKDICEQTGLKFSAAISTKPSTYDSSDVELINIGSGDCVIYTSLLPKNESDYVVNAYKDSFYHIGRYGLDSISKYKLNSPQTNLYWATSGHEGYGLPVGGNAHGLEFSSNQKAFLFFYGLDKVWQVDPSAATESRFKVSEDAIDLSAYNGNDAAPEVFAVKHVDDKLFAFMQRLDMNDSYAKEGSYVAVFDDADLSEEIDTGKGSGNLKGIELPAQNPEAVTYHQDVGFLLAAVSDYHAPGMPKDGGIIKINPMTYVAELLIADEEADLAPYFIDAAFSNVAAVDQDNAFLVAYKGWGDNDLYHFNPQTGEHSLVDGMTGLSLGALKVDPLGNTWVAVNTAADPHIQVLSKTGVKIGRFDLNQGADTIAFAVK